MSKTLFAASGEHYTAKPGWVELPGNDTFRQVRPSEVTALTTSAVWGQKPRWLALVLRLPSAQSLFLLIPGTILVLIFFLIGLLLLALSIFGAEFPLSRGPRFPLPKKLREAAFPYRILNLSAEFNEPSERREGSTKRTERAH